MIRIYNSLTRRKEDFVPLDPVNKRVGLYYCGPTVYDSLHLGHGRAAIVPDLVRRWLEYRGYSVRYVANFTDVDDKIIKRAIAEKRDWREITWTYMEEYYRLISALGNRPTDVQPRATDHIPEMIEIVDNLLKSSNAYIATDGDIYFDTQSFEKYGALSGRKQEDQDAGRSGRISAEELALKKHPSDFILWKLGKNDPEEWQNQRQFAPTWPSPWGDGRPGWHIECSALSKKYLGMPFDLHGGGRDLIFPHHENEKAQNDCAYHEHLGGETSVKYWLHNGFITLKAQTEAELQDANTEGEDVKMSKSLGNVFWIKDLIHPLGPYDPMAVRLAMLASHYRSPLQFNPEILEAAQNRLKKIQELLTRMKDSAAPGDEEAIRRAEVDFEAAMDDDLNTPAALAAVAELLAQDGQAAASKAESLLRVLGLNLENFGSGEKQDSSREAQLIELLMETRRKEREKKNYEMSDWLRARMVEVGVEVGDGRG